jgi:predicted ATPase
VRIDLRIGGYGIRLDEPDGHPVRQWPLPPFDAFSVASQPDEPPDIDLTIRVVPEIPELSAGALIFDSCHGLWTLHDAPDGYVLQCADPRTRGPRSRTALARDFSRGEIWICGHPTRPPRRFAWTPTYVVNPIVELCLVTRLARDGGLLLHASGVLAGREGYIFTGPSGAGKSTLADFFAAAGAVVLSDERVIIRVIAGAFTVWGTPWVGTGRHATNGAASLTALCCISHAGGGHAMRPMHPREVTERLLAQTFLPHWDPEAMDRTLASLVEIAERVECAGLAFAKDPDVVEFLTDRSVGHAGARS